MATSCGYRLLVVLIAYVITTSFVPPGGACFLRNCPLGGKRSIVDIVRRGFTGNEEWNYEPHACPSCGPDLEGTCAGPFTCCHTGYGCVKDTTVCHLEMQVASHCRTPSSWKVCGIARDGFCVANRICCIPEEGCTIEDQCTLEDNK